MKILKFFVIVLLVSSVAIPAGVGFATSDALAKPGQQDAKKKLTSAQKEEQAKKRAARKAAVETAKKACESVKEATAQKACVKDKVRAAKAASAGAAGAKPPAAAVKP